MQLPRLDEGADKGAPNVRFVAVPLDKAPLIYRLESGEVDIALGGFPNLYAGVMEQTLFRESYACLVRREHPTIGATMSIKQFNRAPHSVTPSPLLGLLH